MTKPEYPIIFVFAFINSAFCIYTKTPDWPSLAFEEGTVASLPCPPQGDANAYFWRKGKWLNVSENVASIVHGIPDKSDKYEILPDGTLEIARFSKEDEGRYFCRIASELNECYGSLTVYLKVETKALDVSIAECNPSSSCIWNLDLPAEITLSCSANVLSPFMTLKWYNGTIEVKGDVTTLPGNSAASLKMIHVINVLLEKSCQLSCEAEGYNIPRSVAMVQVHNKKVITSETTGENGTKSTAIIIPLGVLCVILTVGVIFLIVLECKRKKTGTKSEISGVQYVNKNGDEAAASKGEEHTGEGQPAEEEASSPETEVLITTEIPEPEKGHTEDQKADVEAGNDKEEVMKQNNESLSNQLKKKDSEIGVLRKQIDGLNTQIDGLKNQIKDMKDLQKKEPSPGDKDKTIKRLADELRKKDKEIQEKLEQLEEEQQQRQTLQQKTQRLSDMQECIDRLRQEKEEISNEKDEQLQNLRAKITELKEGTVQYLTKTRIRVALVLKPEKYRWEKRKLLGLSSKYTTVCAVLSNTPSEDLTVMAEDIVESTFDGANSCVVIFGNEGSGLVSTLHGDGNTKGLIEGISNEIVSVLEKKRERGFKVIFKMSNTDSERHSFRLLNAEGKVVPNGQDQWENHTEYDVKSKEKVTTLTSRMAPNKSHLNRQGFIRFIIEIPHSQRKKLTRNLTVVSFNGVKHLHRFWTASKPINDLERLLFPMIRENVAIRFLIGHCDPKNTLGVQETCETIEQVLSAIDPEKKSIEQQR